MGDFLSLETTMTQSNKFRYPNNHFASLEIGMAHLSKAVMDFTLFLKYLRELRPFCIKVGSIKGV
jgi:hypothetical protein